MNLTGLIEQRNGNGNGHVNGKDHHESPKPVSSQTDGLDELISEVHDRVVRRIESSQRGDRSTPSRPQLQKMIEPIIDRLLSVRKLALSRSERQRAIRDCLDLILGFGPLEPLLQRDDLTEIMVNGPDDVYVEVDGVLEKTDVKFRDPEHLNMVIERIVAPLGRRVDESQPYVDARLEDGSRVNIILPPLVLQGPTVTIRKFREDPYTLPELVSMGTLNEDMAKFLETAVKARQSVLVSGGTGSGKTTMLNCLSSFIPRDERIITIEDAAELQLQQPHVLQCEARLPNVEGTGAVTIRDLVVNALRMRPDRIIVGECRSGEALDMLQAMNTGHEGSLTTIHANGVRDSLARLETLVLMAGMELPQKAIREQISTAIDIVVQQDRFPDGSRKITSISEVQGMEGDKITLSELFVFEENLTPDGEVRGQHSASGVYPNFLNEVSEGNGETIRHLFKNETKNTD